MDARAKTVRDILYSRDQYLIPFFQRHYSWTRQNWTRLWDDILILMEDEHDGQHFMGPLVCTPLERVPAEVAKFQLIDGQQRLTTLTVLLVAVRDVARERGESSVDEEVTEDFLVHKRVQGWHRLKVLPRTGDREVLRALIDGNLSKEHRRDGLARAYRFFRKVVVARIEDTDDVRAELRRILSALTNQLSLVVITIDGENPYEIFESLNSTGLPLEESDLIRNYVFMQVPTEQQDIFHEEHWQPFEALFEADGSHPAFSATTFYRNFLMRNGAYSRRGATFADFKRQHSLQNKPPEGVVCGLAKFAQYERMLRFPDTSDDGAVAEALSQINRLDLTTSFPLLLKLFELQDGGVIERDELLACLEDLCSFVLRRSICGESTRQYGRWFVAAAKGLGGSAHEALREEWLRRGWPDDDAFTRALQEFALYRREHKKARLILDALEDSAGHKERVDRAVLTIEHVMPQTIGDDEAGLAWKNMLGPEWKVVHVTLLHTLGNLTLSGYNPELSKRAFESKRVILLESRLALNKYFAELNAWDATGIRERSAGLAREVCRLWPRPEGGPAYKPSDGKDRPARRKMTTDDWDDFWAEFRLLAERSGRSLPPMRNRRVKSVQPFRAGRRGVSYFCKAYEKSGQLGAGMAGRGRWGKPVVEGMLSRRSDIEEGLDVELIWRGARLEVTRGGVSIADRQQWELQHQWLLDTLEQFAENIEPIMRSVELEPEDRVPPEDEDDEQDAVLEEELDADDYDEDDDED